MTNTTIQPRAADHARVHLDPASILLVSAALSVIAGGLVAAVTGPLDLTKGSWLAAYLVLVCGVGGWAVGTVQEQAAPGLSPGRAKVQLSCWLGGNAAVIIGSLTSLSLVVDAGALLLATALVIALVAAPTAAAIGRLASWGYRFLLVLLMVSVPVGSGLAHLRSAA
ncbi:hypothetical protein BH23ACT6_BH23ACT6_11200 [soil metagenome]